MVLLIQVVVHFLVMHRPRRQPIEEETFLAEEASEHTVVSPDAVSDGHPASKYPDKRRRTLTRINSDPALDDDTWELDDYYDEPPNLEQRLSQTGDEMMSVSTVRLCKWLSSPTMDQAYLPSSLHSPHLVLSPLNTNLQSCKSLEHLVQEQILAQ
jgi:hypothetical protein